jgi:hypothetical protein
MRWPVASAARSRPRTTGYDCRTVLRDSRPESRVHRAARRGAAIRLAHDAAAVVLLHELVDRHARSQQLVHIDHLGHEGAEVVDP